LPFLSALAPSERYATERGRRHKKITDWAWQLHLQVRRWYPEREIVAVADSTYASLKLLFRCRSLSRPVTFITRLRFGCRPLQTRSTTTPWSEGEATPQGRAAAESLDGG